MSCGSTQDYHMQIRADAQIGAHRAPNIRSQPTILIKRPARRLHSLRCSLARSYADPLFVNVITAAADRDLLSLSAKTRLSLWSSVGSWRCLERVYSIFMKGGLNCLN